MLGGSLCGMSSPKAARTTEEKNHDSVPFNRRSQKKWLACANGQGMSVVLHLVRRVDPSGIAEEYPWCHGLQRAEKHSAE